MDYARFAHLTTVLDLTNFVGEIPQTLFIKLPKLTTLKIGKGCIWSLKMFDEPNIIETLDFHAAEFEITEFDSFEFPYLYSLTIRGGKFDKICVKKANLYEVNLIGVVFAFLDFKCNKIKLSDCMACDLYWATDLIGVLEITYENMEISALEFREFKPIIIILDNVPIPTGMEAITCLYLTLIGCDNIENLNDANEVEKLALIGMNVQATTILKFAKVENIRFNMCQIHKDTFKYVLGLKHLTISACDYFGRLSAFMPLTHLEINGELHISHLVNLESLTVRHSKLIEDSDLIPIKGLKLLHLVGCPNITENILKNSSFERLFIDNCPNFDRSHAVQENCQIQYV
jgi:hypothetical protein